MKTIEIVGLKRVKTIHFVTHRCCLQECDCPTHCHQWGETKATSIEADVTCKNCLRVIAADQKRKRKREVAQFASHKAWADEVRGFE